MRLFVALDLPERVREALRELQARLNPESRGARWARPEGMHVTLKFIGAAGANQCAAIREALARVSSDAPVAMRFRGLGFFPDDRRPRVFWCGIEGSPNLPKLAADVEQSLAPLGIEPEARAYTPHLTLARIAEPAAGEHLVRAVNAAGSMDLGSSEEREFHLYESILKPSGAEYQKLASYPFVKDMA